MDEMTRQLVNETTLDDIAEKYRPIVDIVGIEAFVQLAEYASGDEIYFPKPVNIVAPARNRRIRKEYNGVNYRDLAQRYGLTTAQIRSILKDEPIAGQVSIFDFCDE